MIVKIDDTKYYMDTSALVRIFRFYPKVLIDPIWNKLESLFKSGQVSSHMLVYDEITTSSKKPDLLSKKVSPLRGYFESQKYNQVKIVADIIGKFPGLIDPTREKEQADPWLIAIALEYKNNNPTKKLYIISEESESKPFKIPAVCSYYRIEHINLEGLWKQLGMTFSANIQ